MKEFKGYKCDHCGKLYQKKHACEKHEEKLCSKSPNNQHPCHKCKYLEVGEGEYITSNCMGYDVEVRQKFFFCSKKKVNLHTYKFDRHVKSFDPALFDDDKDLERMPKKDDCKEFVRYGKFIDINGEPF
tara:strand:+ start:206 stop:592 length:387 start_codon:yes stop_codon:yes gene_type:complete